MDERAPRVMLTRQLGRSGITVSALGLGCWPIGGPLIEDGRSVGWGRVDDAESVRALHRALDLGVTFFDTADVYGRSEEILGKAFSGRRRESNSRRRLRPNLRGHPTPRHGPPIAQVPTPTHRREGTCSAEGPGRTIRERQTMRTVSGANR
jgi:Aldo/keto reductase family